jgi:hypothetical protein
MKKNKSLKIKYIGNLLKVLREEWEISGKKKRKLADKPGSVSRTDAGGSHSSRHAVAYMLKQPTR